MREETRQRLGEPWDLIVVGGGITGAGLLREAAREGFRALLLEQRDFAWGTSSRSGKMVHGGLRYLRQGQVRTTRDSVREREQLLRKFPGLVRPLGFLMPLYRGRAERALIGAGLRLYDRFAGARRHRHVAPDEFRLLAPHVREGRGGYAYQDAVTDDARLVLRLIAEARRMGAAALNYARVEELLRAHGGAVEGVVVRDETTGEAFEARARAVVNATGAWADELRAPRPPRLRLLRGSHLIFPTWRFPLPQGVIFSHPADRRPLYALPWEGATLVGTTDVDHDQPMDAEPRITPGEGDYLLAALRRAFPDLDLAERDAVSTFAGVRAVIGTGKRNPSREPRDHAVWREDVLTVTGGKLTTFRLAARDALRAAREQLPERTPPRAAEDGGAAREVDEAARRGAGAGSAERAGDTETTWAEVRRAAREDVVHLDDLLLRRVRLGVLLPGGGLALLPRIRALAQPELGWDDARWEDEARRYEAVWRSAHAPDLARG